MSGTTTVHLQLQIRKDKICLIAGTTILMWWFSNGTICKAFFLFTYLPFLASLLLWWKGLIWFVGRPLFSSIWRIFLLWGSNSHCDSLRALIWLWSPVEEDVSCKRPELSNVGIFLWLQEKNVILKGNVWKESYLMKWRLRTSISWTSGCSNFSICEIWATCVRFLDCLKDLAPTWWLQ